MKRRAIFTVIVAMVSLFGCNEPETIVTNTVHADGSVTRRVEIRNTEDAFDADFYRVPVDSSWSIVRSIEVSDEGDTTWVMVAEKLFANTKMINTGYASADGINSYLERTASFRKRFRWFNTHFVFSERVERFIDDGHPMASYLDSEEIDFIWLPGSVSDELMAGVDSLKYRSMSERTDSVLNVWMEQNLVRSWMASCTRLLVSAGADSSVIKEFNLREGELLEYFSLEWDADSLIAIVFDKEIESGYKPLLDSARLDLEERVERWLDAKVYTIQTRMPGKLTGGNGFFTQSGEVAWPVKPELYLFDDYEMRAESQVPNRWAWMVSLIFVLVVLSGFIYRARVRH
jgi:hypothetical protein